MILQESKALSLFKRLLNVLEEYAMTFPLSNLSKYLDFALAKGKKIIPTDERAKDILEFVLQMGTPAESLQFLTGRRFSAIPTIIKPIYKDKSNRVQVACWKKGDEVSDMISSLLVLEGEKNGSWVSDKGEKVLLIKE